MKEGGASRVTLLRPPHILRQPPPSEKRGPCSIWRIFCCWETEFQRTARAYRLYVSSAEKGNVKALNMLGLLHEDGISGVPDPEGAKVFFQAASEGGDCWADLNLARLALAQQDVPVAVSCFQRALQSGFPDVSQAIIGLIGRSENSALHAVKAQAIRQFVQKEQPRIVSTIVDKLSSGERLCAE